MLVKEAAEKWVGAYKRNIPESKVNHQLSKETDKYIFILFIHLYNI